MRSRTTVVVSTAVLLLGAAVGGARAADSPNHYLARVSPGDPYAGCDISGDGTGTNYPSSEDEPYVATNPLDPRDSIGIYQQDRWSNGGARGLSESYTTDGRHFTQTALPFTHCTPGGLPFQRASDGWVSFGPDGTAYASALIFDATDSRQGVAAATSSDGGRTWRHVTPVIYDTDATVTDDKNSVTADPDHPGTAYQVWDRITQTSTAYDGPGYISITRDGGRTWSTARPFVDTSGTPFSQTIGNEIVADARTDTLYDFFEWQSYTDATGSTPTDLHFAMVRSTDQGRTWSKPVTVAKDTSVTEVDPNAPTDSGKALRAGSGLPNPAIDPVTGELYMAYEGSDFSAGKYDGAELVHSTDGGRTWSRPVLVNQVPAAPAFTPQVAVDALGTVSVTYYDLRYLPAGDTSTLPAAAWLVTLGRGATGPATERQISPVFDWLQAPYAGWGHFLGDYEGLTADGFVAVRPMLVEANSGQPQNSTDAYSGALLALPPGSPAASAQATAATAASATPRAAHRLRR